MAKIQKYLKSVSCFTGETLVPGIEPETLFPGFWSPHQGAGLFPSHGKKSNICDHNCGTVNRGPGSYT